MRRKGIPACLLLVVACLQLSPASADDAFPIPPGKHGKGELKMVQGVPVLFLAGTSKEIGEQHGRLVQRNVKPLLNYPRSFLKKVGRDRDWPLAAAASKLLMLNAGKSYRAEIQSALRVSKLDADSVIVANVMLELRRMGGCSSIIVGKSRSKTGQVIFGRNFDFPPMGVLQKYGIVSVCRPKGKRAFVSVGYPGLFGVISGINDAGLCVATLDVYSSKDGSSRFEPTGQPMMLTFRRVLEECKTVEEAGKLLRKIKATTWMNLSVCDKNGGVVFEITPKNVITRKPVADIVSCTNHFRMPKLAKSTECWRYERLIKSHGMKKLGLADVSKLLHAVNQRTWTVQTMIFEPAAMKLHVALKNPPTSNSKLTTLNVNALLKYGAKLETAAAK